MTTETQNELFFITPEHIREAAKAAMDAMLQMNKISIAELDAAVGE